MDTESEKKSWKYKPHEGEIKQEFHAGRRYYKCDICGKFFFQSGSLKIHISRVHAISLKTDVDCGSCGKSFVDAEFLKLHVKTVHKNHICHHCLKTFIRVEHLRNHNVSVHEGKKDNKCELCGKSFILARNLTNHKQIIHDAGQTQNNHKLYAKFMKNHFLKQRN